MSLTNRYVQGNNTFDVNDGFIIQQKRQGKVWHELEEEGVERVIGIIDA